MNNQESGDWRGCTWKEKDGGARGRRGLLQAAKRRLLWRFVRRYAHKELPRYGHLLHWWGMNDQSAWRDAPVVTTRDKFFGHVLRLDLSDFFQRIAYFVGGYHEFDVVSAVLAALRPGDVFIDAGSNIGLVTLHAAGRVGESGVVEAFECNPVVFDRLRWHVERNGLGNVRLHRVGVGDARGSLPVRLPGFDNQAAATLGGIPRRYGAHVVHMGDVAVIPLDAALNPNDTRPMLVKLDVEGFEVRALRGMRRTLEMRRPAIITEVNGEMLTCCGSDVGEMLAMLSPLGYQCFALDYMGFRGRHGLRLHPVAAHQLALEKDVIWVAPGTEHWGRLAPLMRPPGEYWRHDPAPPRPRFTAREVVSAGREFVVG